MSLAARVPPRAEGRTYDVRRRTLFLVREARASYDEDDALDELGDRIATLAAHIHAATHRLLVMIAEFDRRRGWERDGHRSCAHWLAFRTGIDLGAAREKVRTARALQELPATSERMAQGALSFSQVRALTRVARAENEEDLLQLAEGCTTAQLERAVRGWRRGSRRDEAQRERERHERRTLSVFPDEDGMYVVQGRLEPEVAAVLMRAVEAAADALYRRDREGSAGGSAPIADRLRPEEETRKAAAQRRADAVGLLAERALAAGFGGAGERDEEAGGADVPVSGTRAQRFQVLLHVEEATLRAEEAADDAAPGGAECVSAETSHGAHQAAAKAADPAAGAGPRAHLEDGTRVSGETSRRLACDAAVVRITHRRDGSVLDVGRRTRTIPPALRRALEARDGGCRFPGCGLRFADAHHVRHWADGGETSLGNTLLLCRHHHRLVHEEGWRVAWWGRGRPVFIDPRGGEHFDGRWADRPGGPAPAGSVEALVAENVRTGVEPNWRTAGARWKRLEDVPSPVLLRALEGMG